jgi:large subunit ribosomal protein L27e
LHGAHSAALNLRTNVLWIRQSINYNHLLPTRYALELEGLKGVVAPETFKEVSGREDSKKAIKRLFEERYLAGKNRWARILALARNG